MGDEKQDLVTSMALDRVNTKNNAKQFDPKEIERYVKDRMSTKSAIQDLRDHANESRKAFKARGVPVKEVDQVISIVEKIHEIALDGTSMDQLMTMAAKLLGFRTAGDELADQIGDIIDNSSDDDDDDVAPSADDDDDEDSAGLEVH